MMKKHAIVLLLAAALTSGMAACSQSNSPQAAQSDTASATSNSTTDASKAAERAKKREAVKKQVETVLTPAQTKEFETKIQQGTKMRKALASLDLSSEQKTKIQEILKAAYPHRQQKS